MIYSLGWNIGEVVSGGYTVTESENVYFLGQILKKIKISSSAQYSRSSYTFHESFGLTNYYAVMTGPKVVLTPEQGSRIIELKGIKQGDVYYGNRDLVGDYYPEITSIPITSVKLDNSYEYKIKTNISDYRLTKPKYTGPGWLEISNTWYGENVYTLRGTATEKGKFPVKITISDNWGNISNKSIQEFNITVYEDISELKQNKNFITNNPNPFSKSTTFVFELNDICFVEFKIYNIEG